MAISIHVTAQFFRKVVVHLNRAPLVSRPTKQIQPACQYAFDTVLFQHLGYRVFLMRVTRQFQAHVVIIAQIGKMPARVLQHGFSLAKRPSPGSLL